MNRLLTHRSILWPCLLLLALASCRKDKPEAPAEVPVNIGGAHGVYITNEGNFQWGNATVSWFDPATGEAVEDLYAPANGTGVGDVCQSMFLHDGRGYLVVNNSGKVVVVDPDSFVEQATITGFTSPRYFLPVAGNKAYVTELHGNKIRVLDLATNTIISNIAFPGVGQELAMTAGKVFVTNESKRYLYAVDPATDALIDSVAVSRGGNSLAIGANGKIWLACSGGGGTSAAIYRIDPISLQVETSFNIPSPGQPWRLRANAAGDTLYYLNGGVFQMAADASTLPTTPFSAAAGRNLYGLGVAPNGTVYVADAVDYVQRGMIYRYRPDGSLLGTFRAGTNPSWFCFR